MRLFSRKRNNRLARAETFGDIPRPKPNEVLVVPLNNILWHPDIAVYANNARVPEWYRKVTAGESGLRRCYAVADYVRTGYTIPMWAQVDIRPPLDATQLHWDARFTLDSDHAFQIEAFSDKDADKYFSNTGLRFNQFQYQQSGECPATAARARPHSHYVKLVTPWLFVTAPGYSTLFIPPIWEPNKNYSALAGVVNTDYYHHCNAVLNILTDQPFTIEEGTPILHAIPFKRDDNIRKAGIIRGHDEMYRLLDQMGFNAVHKPKDWFGRYKRQQAKIDKSTEENADV